ncbi:hypothetical protein [uncultured Ruegeria sp.]|uniref:hypothetical protein n=1 Tax=uncultured Ruegeria sp. TaxID=259304 RepID=UPI002636C2FB|nr:hypothetical protein [uncultured Ruegeria sp.]
MKKFILAAFACAVIASPVSAVTISTTSKSVDITCTGSCDFWDIGLLPNDGFNSSAGDWLSRAYGGIGNSNGNATRLTFVNNILNTSFTSQSASSDNFGVDNLDNTLGEMGGWSGSAQYYLAWSGGDPRYILIRSNSQDNNFSWNGKGLSGVDAFGIAPIPLPPAILMLLAGLGGLFVIRKRKALSC